MKQELQEKLFKEFPQFFKLKEEIVINSRRTPSGTKPFMPISFGIEIGDGWHWLLYNLLKNIQHYIKNYNEYTKDKNKPDLILNITQIKEKFGGLRFYYNGGDNYIDGMVGFAESLSYKICEECGTTNNIGMTKGWVSVLCETCVSKDERKKAVWAANAL